MADVIVPPPSIAREVYLEDQIQPAVFEFNQCPGEGVSRLCSAFSLPVTPRNVAHILHIVPGLIGVKIGEFLAKRRNEDILNCYFNEIDMHLPFLEALRTALSSSMHLPAEGEQIDRILQAFSRAFILQNPDSGLNNDQAYILSYATTLLNSDLHNENVTRKMSLESFIDNVKNAMQDNCVSNKFLESIYIDIKNNPFTFRRQVEESLQISAPRLKGFLSRKNDSWKAMYVKNYFVLSNASLYYFKDDQPQNLVKPMGVIQLVSVQISPFKDKEIVIKSTDGFIQNVKFKPNGPQMIKGQQKIFLKASSTEARDKWLYRIKTSSVVNNFNDRPQQVTSSVSSSAFDNEVSEVANSMSDSISIETSDC